MKTAEALKEPPMFKKTGSIVVGALLPTLFVLLAAWGLFDVNRLGWCETGLLSCPQALDVVVHALECAFVASGAALLCLWGFRKRWMSQRPVILVVMGVVIAGLLVAAFPVTLEVRSAIATQFFPYVTALRFGPVGFFIVWGAVSLLVCAAVMRIGIRLAGGSGHSNDAQKVSGTN